MTDREKELVEINKQLVDLLYKINQFHLSGTEPPKSLLIEFSDVERQARLISKARAKDDSEIYNQLIDF